MNHIKEEIIVKDMYDAVEHGICVSQLAYMISRELGLPEQTCYEMAVAGMVHDIGKLKLSRYLYGRAEGIMTIEEIKYVRMHSNLSYDILKELNYSEFILESILHHHENFDGTGYPDNLRAYDIPLGARILRVCDVFSALTSDRPYRSRFDIDTAVELMIDEIKNFDMKVFMAFQRLINTDMKLRSNSIINTLDINESVQLICSR